jgi:Zn-dependent peptidase ImmA (M78 family)
MPEAVEINPELLTWARETAGLSLKEAAEKLGLKDSARGSAAEKLRKLEAGEQPVSETRLQKASAVYRRPLVSFYLPRPPERGERGEDFRTTAAAVSTRDNALLDTLMRDVRARQQLVRELLVEEEARPLPFVASAKIEHGVRTVAAAIRNTLGVTEEHQRAAKGAAELFTLLRAAVERAGIYVLLLGDLGSHHSDIGEEVFRGFALADDIAPFIVINDNDAAKARPFTLMHELAHIWIGASGVSGPLSALSENAIERFCNAVAGEFLLPVEVAALPDLRQADAQTVLRAAARLADEWNVSEGVVTYRFFSRNRISDDVAASLFRMFAERWRAEKKKRKEKESDSGPSYYVVRRHRLGNALLGVVRRAIQEETITHTRAAKILGVSPASIDQLLQERIRAE